MADRIVLVILGVEQLDAVRESADRAAAARAEDPVTLTLGPATVDVVAKRVTVGREGGCEEVRLTPTEWRLFEVLLHNPGRLLSHRRLLTEVWGQDVGGGTAKLRVYMAQLRRKLEPDPRHPRFLLSHPGMGYRYAPDPTGSTGPTPW
jgi:two-component system KDP operon response regulator KdpE